MTEDEKVVRGAWTKTWAANTYYPGTAWEIYIYLGENEKKIITGINEADAWSAARKFTDGRKEEIRKLEADIKWATDARIVGPTSGYDMDAKRRTIARLESLLSAAKKGMKHD